MQGIMHLARLVAFTALVMRALVPTGWMPDAHGLMICSVTPAQQQDHHAPAQDQAHHDACPFAAAPHLASAPDAVHLALPAFHALAAATDRDYASTVAARFTPQSPRAPPRNA